MQLVIRPLDNWHRPPAGFRHASKFRAKWPETLRQLDRELGHLNAVSAALLVDVETSDITIHGTMKDNCSPMTPRVALVIERKDGRVLRYPCDKFCDWRDNVRAIVLSLESLRAVDRFGVTTTGEQYRGWEALPAPEATMSTPHEAKEFLRTVIGDVIDRLPIAECLRCAEKVTHPDVGGDAAKFKKVCDARRILVTNVSP